MIVLGIDLGTTKVAGVLVDTATGAVLDVQSRDHNAGLPAKNSWEHLQDPQVILSAARGVLSGAVE
ncbi:MAG TPA: hypothetical protein VMW69_10670, partial [Spirochaetia bacterium]|nr:hypothetical protein [Spirochaetia bacterium]